MSIRFTTKIREIWIKEDALGVRNLNMKTSKFEAKIVENCKEIFMIFVRTRRTNSHAFNIYLVHCSSTQPPHTPHISIRSHCFTMLALNSFLRLFRITHYFSLWILPCCVASSVHLLCMSLPTVLTFSVRNSLCSLCYCPFLINRSKYVHSIKRQFIFSLYGKGKGHIVTCLTSTLWEYRFSSKHS